MRSISALVVVLLAAGAAAAGDWVVQIGAFRHPSAVFGAEAEPIGPVSTRETASGLTLFQVGSFETREGAREAQARLRAAGYPDAFVRRIGAGVARTGAAEPPAVSAAPRQNPRELFERLPHEVRVRTVYVDGELHVKEGDRFIPLAEYEGGRYR